MESENKCQTRNYIIECEGETFTYHDPKKFPKELLAEQFTGIGKKRSRLYHYVFPDLNDLQNRNMSKSKRVDTWEALPNGEWYMIANSNKLLYKIVIRATTVDPQVIRALSKEFAKAKNRYEAALIYTRLSPKYAEILNDADREFLIVLLKMPVKSHSNFRSGKLSLCDYLVANALTEEDREKRRNERKREKLRAYEESFVAAMHMREVMYNCTSYADYSDSGPLLSEYDKPKYGEVKIMMHVGQGEQRRIDAVLAVMPKMKMYFPTSILGMILNHAIVSSVSRWLQDLPFAADRRIDAAPGINTLCRLRKLNPQLYLEAICRNKIRHISISDTTLMAEYTTQNAMFEQLFTSKFATRDAQFALYAYTHFPAAYERYLEPFWVPTWDSTTNKISMVGRDLF